MRSYYKKVFTQLRQLTQSEEKKYHYCPTNFLKNTYSHAQAIIAAIYIKFSK